MVPPDPLIVDAQSRSMSDAIVALGIVFTESARMEQIAPGHIHFVQRTRKIGNTFTGEPCLRIFDPLWSKDHRECVADPTKHDDHGDPIASIRKALGVVEIQGQRRHDPKQNDEDLRNASIGD